MNPRGQIVAVELTVDQIDVLADVADNKLTAIDCIDREDTRQAGLLASALAALRKARPCTPMRKLAQRFSPLANRGRNVCRKSKREPTDG